jgi:hypothetical protein
VAHDGQSLTLMITSAAILFAQRGPWSLTASLLAIVYFAGSTSNNVSGKITTLSPTVMGFGAITLFADEGPVSNMTCVGQASVVFANSGDTITRRVRLVARGRLSMVTRSRSRARAAPNMALVIDTLTATVDALAGGGRE